MKSCRQVWDEMTEATKSGFVRNFSANLDMGDYTIETEMFPVEVLEAYSSYNLGDELNEEHKKFFNEARGGKQGDYRQGMPDKIANVVDCLRRFPNSKRALITISNNPKPSHQSDDDAKCMREIHFYIEEGALHGSVFFRAQAAQIFPKNIHFCGKIMARIAKGLGLNVGNLHYTTSILVSDRS